MARRGAASTSYGRRGRSRFVSALLLVAALALVFFSGFLFGRYVIGEGYLRQTVASAMVASQPSPPVPPPAPLIPRTPVSIPPLEEEPPAATASEGESSLPQPQEPATQGPEPGAAQPLPTPTPSPSSVKPAPAGSAERGFSVQVGNFVRRESAEAFAEELRQSGRSAQVVLSVTGDEGTSSYRVLCGNYRTEAAARKAADELKDQGHEAFIVRSP